MLGKAIAIAAKGFENIKDKGGKPYILHCLRVMNNVEGDDFLKTIAILHDTIEDQVITIEELFKLEFSERVIKALILLTHKKSQSYEDYIKTLSHNEDAVKVKLADLRDNSDITRLKGISKKDLDRVEKYHKAYLYLSNI